jgi:plasmid stabilization system protein ParE
MASGYQIQWSRRALRRLANIIAYLEERWTDKEIRHFVKKLDSRLELVRKHPETYPFIDEERKIRMSVLTKQTTIYYRDNNSKRIIEIVTLFDNRSNRKK